MEEKEEEKKEEKEKPLKLSDFKSYHVIFICQLFRPLLLVSPIVCIPCNIFLFIILLGSPVSSISGFIIFYCCIPTVVPLALFLSVTKLQYYLLEWIFKFVCKNGDQGLFEECKKLNITLKNHAVNEIFKNVFSI